MKNILIDIHYSGSKVCVVKDDLLEEFWIERRGEVKHVGNIYKGKVVNVLNGMQACFVDIGLDKNAFLYAGDTLVNGKLLSHNGSLTPDVFPLKAGDIIMCQVLKESFGNKGCRVSMNISIPGHNLVLAPFVDYVCVSKKIANEYRKAELEKFIDSNRREKYGFIARTESELATDDEILDEMNELSELWKMVYRRNIVSPINTCIFDDGSLITRTMRDILRADVDKIYVNDKDSYDKIKDDYKGILSRKDDMITYYDNVENMLSHFGVDVQIDSLFSRQVPLSNGAYLVIDPTEALTIIDVNTGKYVGEVNLEETVFITNKIAVKEIARQLRLRNIGGIIIVDFIDMNVIEHKNYIMEQLSSELAKDRIKCILVGMTELGLVQITRKKARSSIEDFLLKTCPYCNGNGYIYSEENMIMRIRDYLVEMFKVNPQVNAVKLIVNPQVFAKLFSLRYLEKDCETIWAAKRIYVIPDPLCHIEKYSVIKMTSNIIDLPNNAKMLY